MGIAFIFSVLTIVNNLLRTMPDFKANEPIFHRIEIVCITWFTLELVLRLLVSPNYTRFFRSTITITDILSVTPYFIYVIVEQYVDGVINSNLKSTSMIFRSFAFINITRYFDSMRILAKTIKQSFKEIIIYFTYLILGVLLFSTFLYYMEVNEVNSDFTSIPATFW